jgi:hypothetical protein
VTAVAVPYDLAAGQVRLVVAPQYRIGDPVRVQILVRATRGTLRGPVRARVVASGISGEAEVRVLDVRALEVAPGAESASEIVWDGSDARGALVPDDDYGLVLDFESVVGSIVSRGQAGAILHLRRP